MAGRLRWGILGTGTIAHLQTRDLIGNGFTVAAVGSRRQAAADAFAAEFGIGTAHGSYEALVADPGVDAIYVATPHPGHHDAAPNSHSSVRAATIAYASSRLKPASKPSTSPSG